METSKEAFQRLIIALFVMILIFLLLVEIVSNQDRLSAQSSTNDIIFHLETFNFQTDYGFLLLFFSFFVGAFAVYLFEFLVLVTRKEFGGVIFMAQNLTLKNHAIVVGGGRIGSRIASLLRDSGERVLVIEKDETVAEELKRNGFKVLKENALEEKTFKMANVRRAKTVFACLGQDVDNIIVILNARSLNPDVPIISRCNSLKNVGKFRQLGANEVVLPEIVGADRMVYLAKKQEK
ncbi:MAG: NAD-binding protein [Nanoarchaeota archaeon]|nr:NAD-binding protein [Nanoarchaeota archaeon]